MNENKVEVAGKREDQPEPSSVIQTSSGTTSKAIEKESAAESPLAGHINGAMRKTVADKPASEKTPAGDEPDQSLGTFLIAARERRGLTAEDVIRETRLPAHYLRMMETNDYSEISDQLYLVPFLRRYAGFLSLDQEDVAMRFVREVQRADSIPPARLDQPLIAEPRKRRGWAGAIAVVGFLAVAAGVYVYESDRHRQAGATSIAPSANAASDNTTSAIAQPPATH